MKDNNYYPFLIAIIVALGGFLLGFDGVVNSGAIPFYKVSFNISDQPLLIGFSAGAIILGAIFGNLSAGVISDKLGRKPSLVITSVLFMIGALGTALAPDIYIFILCKFIAGLGVGMAILIAPVYIAEIAPPKLRGKLVTFNQLNIVIGLSAAYFSNYYILQLIEDPATNWRWMLGVGFLPAALYFGLLFLIPESPRWLIARGKIAPARDTLFHIGGEEHAHKELEAIKASLAKEANQEKATFREVFAPKMKFVLLIGFALAFFQQISGINAVLYYAPMIFETAGGTRDAAFMQAIIVGIVFTGMTLVSMALIDRLGRKPLLLIGTSVMTFFLLLVATSFYQATYHIEKSSVDTICEQVYKQGIAAEGKAQNPHAYQFDSLVFNSHQAMLTLKGRTLATVSLSSPNMVRKNREIEILRAGLTTLDGKSYQSEIRFFAAIKDALASAQKDIYPPLNILNNYNGVYKPLILNESISINAMMVLIGILGFISGFSISLGPVMWAMFSEIFPNKLRGLTISIVGALNALTSFGVATVFPSALEYLGASNTFLVFAAFMGLCLVFVFKYIPETKNKTLEEIETELVSG